MVDYPIKTPGQLYAQHPITPALTDIILDWQGGVLGAATLGDLLALVSKLYGLGSTALSVDKLIADANALTETGFYGTGTAFTGSPVAGTNAGNSGEIIHLSWASTHAVQLHVPTATGIALRMRNKVAGIWSAWRIQWDDSNLPVTTFAKTILDDIDAPAARATLGLTYKHYRIPFTASGTWTVPAGTLLTDVFEFIGTSGGGGGAGGTVNANMGGAGSGGITASRLVTGLVPGQVVTFTIGVGGTAGAVAGNGGPGGSTIINLPGGVTMTIPGGNAGGGSGVGGPVPSAGAGINADIVFIGGDGGASPPAGSSSFLAGNGGATIYGGAGRGGRGGASIEAGTPAQGFGAGGGGGGASASSAQNGGAGKAGYLEIRGVTL